MSTHSSRVFATWVRGVLQAGGLAAEIGIKPATVPTNAGWSVVYPIAGGQVAGTLQDPNTDVTPDIQITSSSLSAEQTLWQVDKVRALIVAAVPATLSDGRKVIFVEPSWPEPTLIRDDDIQPPVWWAPDRFSMRTA